MNTFDTARFVIEKSLSEWGKKIDDETVTKRRNLYNIDIPIDYENVVDSAALEQERASALKTNESANDKVIWGRITLIDAGANQVELGQCGISKHDCNAHIDLFVPKNTGTRFLRMMLSDLASFMRQVNNFDSVRQRNIQIRQSSNQGLSVDDVWCMGKLIIPLEVVVNMELFVADGGTSAVEVEEKVLIDLNAAMQTEFDGLPVRSAAANR